MVCEVTVYAHSAFARGLLRAFCSSLIFCTNTVALTCPVDESAVSMGMLQGSSFSGTGRSDHLAGSEKSELRADAFNGAVGSRTQLRLRSLCDGRRPRRRLNWETWEEGLHTHGGQVCRLQKVEWRGSILKLEDISQDFF